jgi:hypothetical protein
MKIEIGIWFLILQRPIELPSSVFVLFILLLGEMMESLKDRIQSAYLHSCGSPQSAPHHLAAMLSEYP